MKHVALIIALAATPSFALAQTVPLGPSPQAAGWQEITFDDYRPNRWLSEGGALVVETDRSSSVLYIPVSADPAAAPMLRWRWIADAAPPATDLSRKGGDDRTISVAVGFAYDSAQASLGERMRRVMVETVAGREAPGRVLTFVFGGQRPRGTIMENPYAGESGRQVILRPGDTPTGEWFAESVDLDRLYRQVWGSAPPRVTQIALSADSDDTGTAGRARITDLGFGPR